MLAMKNQIKLKRMLSTLLAVVMLLGLLPTGAMAQGETAGTPRDQVSANNYEWSDGGRELSAAESQMITVDGKAIPAIGTDEMPFGDLSMTASKTATQATDAKGKLLENLFDVNVTVTTNQSMDEMSSSADTAVVLVLDLSWSMAGDIDELKAALNGFLATYSNVGGATTSAPKRMVQIVVFSKNVGTGLTVWTDAATAAGKAAAQKVIDSISVNNRKNTISCNNVEYSGGTNIDGGLKEAKKLIGQSLMGSDGEKEIPAGNRYVLLLSDGSPNQDAGEDYLKTETVTYSQVGRDDGKHQTDDTFTKVNFPVVYEGYWADDSNRDWVQPMLRAAEIREKAQLYSIYFGDSKDYRDNGYYSENKGRDVNGNTHRIYLTEWMSSFSDKFYTSDKADELNNMFKNFATIMTGRAQAWELDDPMGQGVEFVGFLEDGALRDDPNNYENKKATQANGKVEWNLKEDFTFDSNSNKYTYTLSYRVRLDNIALDGAVHNDVYYPLNNDTTLTYMFDKTGTDGSSYSSALGTAHLSVPAVEPLFATLSFTKVNVNDQPLDGATFKLWPKGATDKSFFYGISDKGVVEIVLPSGHTYELHETTASSKEYITPTGSMGDVEVKWGEVVSSPVKDGKIVNDRNPMNADIEIKKVWMPEAPADMESLTVTLTGNTDPATTQPVTLTPQPGTNSWIGIVKDVPMVDVKTGDPISYTVTEGTIDGYRLKNGDQVGKVEVKFDKDSGNFRAVLQNVRYGNTEAITVQKNWLAPEDQRTAVTLGLFQSTQGESKSVPEPLYSVTLDGTEQTPWQATFGSLDKYDESGNEYHYFVMEMDADGAWKNTGSITLKGKNYNVSVDGYTVTNTIQQEGNVTVSGTKSWVDGGNSGNIRPETLEITLLADGHEVAAPENSADNTVSGSDTAYSFEGLPKYALPAAETDSDLAKAVIAALGDTLDGHEIVYSVTDSVEGYTHTGGTADDNYNLTNTRADIGDTTDITVTKVWEDNNTYELRPSVTLELRRTYNNSEDTEFQMMTEFTQIPDEEGNYPDEQSYDFGALPLYEQSTGYPYHYYAVEQGKDGNNTINGNDGAVYDVKESGLTVINSLKGGSGLTSVTVMKNWVIPAGMEKPEVTITLVGDNAETNVHAIVLDGEVDETGETDAWVASFTDLPKYKDGGGLIAYTVTESELTGFISTLSSDIVTGGIVTVTNTLDVNNEEFRVAVSGAKTWERSDSEDTTTNSVVRLQSDIGTAGSFADVPGMTAEVTDENSAYSFTDLPQYVLDNGGTTVREIQYRVTDSVEGYSPVGGTADNNDNYNLTNKFNQTYTSISGEKLWNDDPSAETPDSVWICLFRDNALYEKAQISADTEWKYAFGLNGENAPSLPVHKSLNEDYRYEIRELSGENDTIGIDNGGTVTIGDNIYDVTYAGNGLVINTLSGDHGSKTRTFTANKLWVGPVAEETTLYLLQNSETVSELTLGTENAVEGIDHVWQGTFLNAEGGDTFAKYDDQGNAYAYSVTEKGAEGGFVTLDGVDYNVEVEQSGNAFTVTNKVVQKSINISVEKIWANMGDTQPATVIIDLFADGNPVESITLPQEVPGNLPEGETFNPWAYSFEAPLYNDEGVIEYTVHERGEADGHVQYGNDHYDVTYDGMNITNTFTGTDVYSYIVQRYYSYTQDGVTSTYTDHDASRTYGAKDQAVSVDPADFAAFGGKTYNVSAVRLDGAELPADQSVSFTLEANARNVVQLYYTLSETTPVSYYRVDRVYNSYLDGVQTGTQTITGTVNTGNTGDTIPAQDAEALKNGDGFSAYTYAGGNGALTLANAGETYVLTLTYELRETTPPAPDEYSYRVDRVYNHYQDGVLDGAVTVTGDKIVGAQDDVILITETDSYKTADNRNGYSFVSGAPATDGGVGVTLEQPGTVYAITLTYELRETTPTPPPEPEVETFNLTLHYVDRDTGRELTTVPFTMQGEVGTAWDVTDRAERQFYGYIFDSWDGNGDGLTGIFDDHDVEINVYYVRDAEVPDEEIPDEPVPLGPKPNTPDGETIIDDGQVPLSPGPEGDDEVTIEDGDVPLGDLPQTGFAAAPVNPAVTLGMLALSLSMAAAGLAITYTRKIKEEDE